MHYSLFPTVINGIKWKHPMAGLENWVFYPSPTKHVAKKQSSPPQQAKCLCRFKKPSSGERILEPKYQTSLKIHCLKIPQAVPGRLQQESINNRSPFATLYLGKSHQLASRARGDSGLTCYQTQTGFPPVFSFAGECSVISSTGLKNLQPKIQRHFFQHQHQHQLEEAFPALTPSFSGEAGTRNCSFQDRAELAKHRWNRSFSIIQVRMNPEVTIPQLSSLSDGQRLLRLQQGCVQQQRCPVQHN